MPRDAFRITVDRTEFLVAAGAIEARRLKTHRVDIGPPGPEPSRFVLNCLDQLRTEVLPAKFLLHPEQLDEQHRGPDLAHNPADDLVAFAQRDGEALVLLLLHLLG